MNQLLSDTDQAELRRHGISPEEASRQLRILHDPPRRVTLIRPCTINDGIETIAEGELDELAAFHQQAAAAGRWLKFVPASGAASRMFAMKSDDDPRRLCEHLHKFAFHEVLAASFRDAGIELSDLLNGQEYSEIVDRLLNEPGLAYASQPKGLLLFHHYANGNRTPFEEHLREAASSFRGENNRCRAHFTVSEEHRNQFEALLAQLQPLIAEEMQVQVEVDFSVQKPSTDTLALNQEDAPARDSEGHILRRPGGHGALLENLNDLAADLIFVKNIDNVCHQRLQQPTQRWVQTLGGILIRLEQQVYALARALDGDESEQSILSAEQFLSERFPGSLNCDEAGDDLKTRHDRAWRILNRPVRICGMVRNEGEPGGGPFWVRGADGSESVQIVESAETDPDDQNQQAIFRSSTHFNPVFMALGVRDYQGHPFHLPDFVDEDRYILAKKVSDGKTIRVLERPGLWNGSMAHWNTVFVEVPKQVFSPVKTVFDLLRDEHQP